ncbi:hypothetical protein BGX29_001717 [Mortierella sp. GBA35]|nr:hypothetical protein BGX23_004955 [Mortierella sp. AD031]KAF9104543.1 hypothetical protein BGX29_001717 [Mortierella sp. GBA35]KAG0216916.1 hypothetical protein BGX33_011834 [Mortierella sp. NVP41]
MTERLTNTANQYIGAAKQTLGQTLGYPDMAADGARQKSQAETAQKVADAKVQADRLQHTAENNANSIVGGAKQTVGQTLGLPGLAADGAAQKSNAETQQKVDDARAEVHGAGQELEGKIKQKVADLTHDSSLKADGVTTEAQGTLQRNV